MINKESIPNVLGKTAYDDSHNAIGQVSHVYVDDRTEQPEWMTVHTGMQGSKVTFVPMEPAEMRGGEIVVPFQKEQVRNAPNVEADVPVHLSEQDEANMYDYYGMRHPTVPGTAAPQQSTDEAMTRSEERLRVGVEGQDTGRVHLRKYVVTEDQQQTVPVRKEKLRIEREPINDQNRERAMSGPDISEADFELVQHEEHPVVSKETVPVERVRLTKDESTENQTVRGKVRRERIDTQGLQEQER